MRPVITRSTRSSRPASQPSLRRSFRSSTTRLLATSCQAPVSAGLGTRVAGTMLWPEAPTRCSSTTTSRSTTSRTFRQGLRAEPTCRTRPTSSPPQRRGRCRRFHSRRQRQRPAPRLHARRRQRLKTTFSERDAGGDHAPGAELLETFHHERPLSDSWVWDAQVGPVNVLGSEQQDVHIYDAGTPTSCGPAPAFPLDCLRNLQK